MRGSERAAKGSPATDRRRSAFAIAPAAPETRSLEITGALVATVAIGLAASFAFGADNSWRAPLALLALLPLAWAALRLRLRDTFLVAALVAGFAGWNIWRGDSAPVLAAFTAAMVLPSLALSAAVSRRRPGDARLQSLEQQYRLMVQSVHDYALYMLDPTGKVVSWNAGAARIKQYSAEDIIGRHFSCFYTEEDRNKGLPARALRFAQTEGHYEAEGWRVRKDGTRFWANAVIDPVRDASGELIGFAKITRDITERKQAQEALERTREQLAQAQKMEAIGQLTGGIAHDFNNLLMIVDGYAQSLMRDVSEPKQQRAAVAIQSAAERGAALTRQLLTFSRRQALNPVTADLHLQLGLLRDMLIRTLPSNISLVLDIPDGIGRVRVDIGEFDLAIVNLVVNARDAMPKGGTIAIAARNRDIAENQTGAPQERTLQEKILHGKFVELAVRDTGTGIPPALQSRVFEPFFTTKAIGKGTGLGLSQVYGFAHQAGGSVVIDSAAGQGTVVTLLLPRSYDVPASPTVSAADSESGPINAQILLVEDNDAVAEVTSAMLKQAGCHVTHATCPADALICLQAERKYDLVLSDIVMPGGIDGLQLAENIRHSHPGLPVLLISGYSEAAASVAHSFRLLRKPFSPAELNRAVREAVNPES